jgi:hypothetical protein
MRRNLLLQGIVCTAAAGLLPSAAAARTDIHPDVHIGTPPQLVVVPQTPVYYAPALPYNYFFDGGQYYIFQQGMWFYGPTYNGPWAVIPAQYVPRPILAIPVTYDKVRPGHRKKHGPPPWAPARGHRKQGDD